MNRKIFIRVWFTVQSLLFILPIIMLLIYVPYDISYDELYVKDVNSRAFESNNKLTDFKEAVVADNDANGKYIEKVWMLENKSIYYINAIFIGLLLGFLLQLCNMMWITIYDDMF